MNEQSLLEKLRKIESLIARPGTAGEGIAAAEARKRLMERLASLQKTDPPIEYKFSVPDSWSRRLFLALLQRYGLRSYRYSGQRYSTVMVRVPKTFVDETLWPEYVEMSSTLRTYLEEVTDKVICDLFQQKPQNEADAVQESTPKLPSGPHSV